MNMNISALEDLSSDLFVLSIGRSWAHWSPEPEIFKIFKILYWQDWLVHLRSWKVRILLEDQSIICWWLLCWRDLMADRMRSQVDSNHFYSVPSQQTGQVFVSYFDKRNPRRAQPKCCQCSQCSLCSVVTTGRSQGCGTWIRGDVTKLSIVILTTAGPGSAGSWHTIATSWSRDWGLSDS